MVGLMGMSREDIKTRIDSIRLGNASDVAAKLDHLRKIRRELLDSDSESVVEFLSRLLDLLSDGSSPVRKNVTELIGEIGLKHLELLPEIVPALMGVLNDDTLSVCRQAILCSIDIFRCCLVKVAIQGLYSAEINESLRLSWECMLKLKDELCSIAFGAGSESRRLSALKFIEHFVLLYTTDGSLDPRSDQVSEEKFEEFDISWVRSGHPILNVSELAAEASQILSLLLDQLRVPHSKSNSYLMINVLIRSLSIIARKRPAFYGRILPVLLGFKPSISDSSALHLAGVNHALKKAFESCLDCTHHAASPWRNRLVIALNGIKVEAISEPPPKQILETDENEINTQAAQICEDEKPLVDRSNAGKKRTGTFDKQEFTESDIGGKRARLVRSHSEEPGSETSREQETTSTSGSSEDGGPVQQLVAMFGALVAQGEKAVASLEILISSISADLLAEVVMANMRNLPPGNFKTEASDSSSLLHSGTVADLVQSDTHIKHLSLLLADVLPHPSSAQDDGYLLPAAFEETQHEDELRVNLDGSNAASLNEFAYLDDVPSTIETFHFSTVAEANDIIDAPNEIPGIFLPIQNAEFSELSSSNGLADAYDKNSSDLVDDPQADKAILGHRPIDFAHLFPAERSEELSSNSVIIESASVNLPTAAPEESIPRLVLPKISAPVIYLVDEQKDKLHQLAFVHIIDAYRQVSVAGGSQARFSILAHSGIEFPTELDPWKLLKEHILSDYINNEGHELTLRVLYRLFGEAEAGRDFFSSTNATCVYETFLLQVAETLTDSFPASDKSLTRLLCEVPYLPKSIFEMLGSLSCPGNDDKELHGGDRVTQGLSVVWSLILQRPPIRDSCLKIALKSSIHFLEEVRMKTIRLVANKLYPLSSISGKIEIFAKEMMLSVIGGKSAEADKIRAEKHAEGNPFVDSGSSATAKEIFPDINMLSASESVPSSTVTEVLRCMSLYFALCTKKHSLLREVFDAYEGASEVAKQAIHQQIPLLVRTIGSSPDLLTIISDPPTGSEGLIIQVVQTLTDGIVPSAELVLTITKLYDKKLQDVDVLIPVLPFLPRHEVLGLFPRFVNSPLDKFQVALSRVVQGFNQSAQLLTPAEALISIHGIDPDRDGIPLKKVTDACNACFEHRHVFSQQVLAKVLNQLVEQIPLPLLFMRTVMQAVGAFPSLVEFIMEILSRLVNKQIWKYPKLWVGFLKCALMTRPHSFSVLLQLPTAQLGNGLTKIPAIKDSLVAHAQQPHIRSSLPRSTLVVLGIEPPLPPPPPPPQNVTTETQTSRASSSPQTSETQREASSSQITPTESNTKAATGGDSENEGAVMMTVTTTG